MRRPRLPGPLLPAVHLGSRVWLWPSGPVLYLPMTDVAAILARARTRVVSRDNPLLSTLPPWVQSFRPHQVTAIEEIVNEYETGKRLVVVDAPTGAGKSLIAESVRRILESTGTYLCTTKALQEQIRSTFPYAAVVMGRRNYDPTDRDPLAVSAGVTCEDCDKKKYEDEEGRETWKCRFCAQVGACPYEMAKHAALSADLACLNTSYWLTEVNGPGRFSKRSGLTIVDETDTLESELMGYVEVNIGSRNAQRWGIRPPSKVTVESAWGDWCEETLEALSTARRKAGSKKDDVRQAREVKRLSGLQEQVRGLREGLREGELRWVYTGNDREISFKPVTVETLGQRYVWKHGDRWLLMSATVISAEQMMESLGWEEDYAVVRVPSTFDRRNRKVIARANIDMAHRNRETSWPLVGDELVRILKDHPTDRVLVHSVSYALTDYLVKMVIDSGISRPVFSYSSSSEKGNALDGYLAAENSVMIAPSMDRGVDLPGDACRCQVIVKVPFLNIGDRQVSARLHSYGGQLWYVVSAIRTLVQMSGRAVRSETDHATTYVLDSQFVDGVWNRGGRQLFPAYFRDAIIWQ